MITHVSIANFKSIKRIPDIELKPLTLLTGANSSGKSNIMEALSFFAQASRLQDTSIGSHLDVSTVYSQGDVRRYPHRELEKFVAYKGRKKAQVYLEISMRPTNTLDENIRKSLTKELRGNIPELANITKITSVGYAFGFDFNSPLPTYSQRILLNERILMSIRQKGPPQATIEKPETFRGKAIAGFAGNIFASETFRSISPENTPIIQPLSAIALLILEYIKERAKMIYFISGERGKIEPEDHTGIPQTGLEPTWVGSNGQFLIEILSRCLTRQPEETKKIKKWAQRFQLSDIRAGHVRRGILEANFTDDLVGVNLNTALAGLGSRQMLSIITQIFLAEQGSVIMIEEPEISLHPENQVLLHELFSEAISEGKQIICSTHSPFFVLALSRIVKKKQLTVDQIAVYHVTKDGKGTHIEPLKLDEHGFLASGVPSFMKVEKELFHDWSESLEEE